MKRNDQVALTGCAPVNLARIPGQILFGHLSDKVSARKLIIIMALASSVSVYAIWGSVAAVHGGTTSKPTGTGTAGLLIFSMVFGAFAGRSVDVLLLSRRIETVFQLHRFVSEIHLNRCW